MRRILPHELALNEPLPWTLYDQQGNLLLREGYVLSVGRHMESLLLRGAYVREEVEEEDAATAATAVAPTVAAAPKTVHSLEPVFARATRLANSLERLHADLLAGHLRQEMRMLVEGMAHVISQACEQDADALLAALHTNRSHPYLVVQQLLGATLTEIVAREAQTDETTRTTWVCAALTRDVGMVDVQAQLDTQTTALTAEQTMVVRHHPTHAVAMLEQMGVKDAVWLQVVREHQERCDGSGYPGQLLGTSIADGAKLLAAADAYAAMVTPRANRKAKLPREALRSLYLERDKAYDSAWVQQVIKSLTMYPPGSIVQLANGERGVVRARASEGQGADVWVVWDAAGAPLSSALPRDTTQATYAVVQPVDLATLGSAAQRLPLLWQ